MTGTAQGDRQQAVRAVTGTTEVYEGDWQALFNLEAIPGVTYNERLLGWINSELSASYDNLPNAMQAYAAAQGAYNWSSLATLGSLNYERVTEAGSVRVTEAGVIRVTEAAP